MNVRIRPATVEDAAALCAAEAETARIPGRLVSRPYEFSVAAFASRIEEFRETGCYVVAESADESTDEDGPSLRGHAVLEPMMHLEGLRHVMRLTIVVHPGWTGRGVGTALLRHLQSWAAATPGVHKIELNVRSVNEGAVRLYRRVGFVQEGIFRDRVRLPDGSFVDDISMAWFPPNVRRDVEPAPGSSPEVHA